MLLPSDASRRSSIKFFVCIIETLRAVVFFFQICEVGGLVMHKRTVPNLITFFIIYQFGCDYFCKYVDDAMTNT
jgi:hypothetical protein